MAVAHCGGKKTTLLKYPTGDSSDIVSQTEYLYRRLLIRLIISPGNVRSNYQSRTVKTSVNAEISIATLETRMT
jgi:hypothetical protein